MNLPSKPCRKNIVRRAAMSSSPASRAGRGFRKGRAECLYIFYIFYRFYRNCQVGTGTPVLQEGMDDLEDEPDDPTQDERERRLHFVISEGLYGNKDVPIGCFPPF